MSEFVLQPTKLLLTRLIADKDQPPVAVTFEQLCKKFVPDRNVNELRKLMFLKQNSFVGLVRSALQPGKIVVFFLHNLDGTGELGRIMSQDATFGDRVVASYKIEKAEYDGRIRESADPDEAA